MPHVPASLAWIRGPAPWSLAIVALFAACDEHGQPIATGDPDASLARRIPDPPPLSQVPVPQMGGSDIVDQDAAVRLGKALFWDVQAGGDGETACASCHFAAGADNRVVNTIAPGANGAWDTVTGPGQIWDGTSIGATTDDIVGSQGVVGTTFVGIDPDPNNPADICLPDETAPFHEHRRVTGRNAPSVVAAVYFRHNFWDGRANDRFNGLDPFGNTGNASGGSVDVTSASLASQAVGPPNNEVEMSCFGRTFNGPNSLASKMLARAPLGLQLVDPTDSVLGSLSAWPEPGLTTTYAQLIEDAFGPALAADAEAQFSRIWGQAIQAYEATLIPDDTPFDRYLAGDETAMTENQLEGWERFKEVGCFDCHAGSELSDATYSFAEEHGLVNSDGGDQGFHNLGVRPTEEDLGRAGTGPNGVSWSESGSTFDRGAFKTPALRNVKLTGPYMHNGGFATLGEAFAFYVAKGFFDNPEKSGEMDDLRAKSSDASTIGDFVANALTDCRTEMHRAPFDHPELPLPNGDTLPAVGAAGLGDCP